MKADIDCLKNLNTAQLHQLRVFIENLGYRKAAERASEEFNEPIHKTALQRFMLRAAPAEFLDQDLDSEEASRQILKFAADGQPEFTATTVQILEKLAFQLALTCTSMDEDMNALTRINTMLCRFRNSAVRERMAAVQEGKLKLRQQQFEKLTNHDTDTKIQELNEKIAAAFDQHPVLTAIRDAEESAANPNPNPLDTDSDRHSPAVPPKNKKAKSSPVPPKRSDGGSVPSSVPSPKSAVTAFENARSASPQCQMKNAQCSMLNENPENPYENNENTTQT